MNLRKKGLVFLMCFAMLLTTGCGGNESSSTPVIEQTTVATTTSVFEQQELTPQYRPYDGPEYSNPNNQEKFATLVDRLLTNMQAQGFDLITNDTFNLKTFDDYDFKSTTSNKDESDSDSGSALGGLGGDTVTAPTTTTASTTTVASSAASDDAEIESEPVETEPVEQPEVRQLYLGYSNAENTEIATSAVTEPKKQEFVTVTEDGKPLTQKQLEQKAMEYDIANAFECYTWSLLTEYTPVVATARQLEDGTQEVVYIPYETEGVESAELVGYYTYGNLTTGKAITLPDMPEEVKKVINILTSSKDDAVKAQADEVYTRWYAHLYTFVRNQIENASDIYVVANGEGTVKADKEQVELLWLRSLLGTTKKIDTKKTSTTDYVSLWHNSMFTLMTSMLDNSVDTEDAIFKEIQGYAKTYITDATLRDAWTDLTFSYVMTSEKYWVSTETMLAYYSQGMTTSEYEKLRGNSVIYDGVPMIVRQNTVDEILAGITDETPESEVIALENKHKYESLLLSYSGDSGMENDFTTATKPSDFATSVSDIYEVTSANIAMDMTADSFKSGFTDTAKQWGIENASISHMFYVGNSVNGTPTVCGDSEYMSLLRACDMLWTWVSPTDDSAATLYKTMQSMNYPNYILNDVNKAELEAYQAEYKAARKEDKESIVFKPTQNNAKSGKFTVDLETPVLDINGYYVVDNASYEKASNTSDITLPEGMTLDETVLANLETESNRKYKTESVTLYKSYNFAQMIEELYKYYYGIENGIPTKNLSDYGLADAVKPVEIVTPGTPEVPSTDTGIGGLGGGLGGDTASTTSIASTANATEGTTNTEATVTEPVEAEPEETLYPVDYKEIYIYDEDTGAIETRRIVSETTYKQKLAEQEKYKDLTNFGKSIVDANGYSGFLRFLKTNLPLVFDKLDSTGNLWREFNSFIDIENATTADIEKLGISCMAASEATYGITLSNGTKATFTQNKGVDEYNWELSFVIGSDTLSRETLESLVLNYVVFLGELTGEDYARCLDIAASALINVTCEDNYTCGIDYFPSAAIITIAMG